METSGAHFGMDGSRYRAGMASLLGGLAGTLVAMSLFGGTSHAGEVLKTHELAENVFALANLVGPDGLDGTKPVYADETFSEATTLTVGETRLEVRHPGPAHTPGDSFVWLPERKILFSGDIVYMDRMLSIGPQSEHKAWISAFEALAALEPKVVVPGHGDPADIAKATADSYDYLVFLRQALLDLIDQGAGIEDVGTVDQSRFGHLANYHALKGRNAQRVYEELEWE